ncbi:hypothetical protein NDU88_002421 [Pleurodeles waltl]|uniref:Uncharacterized protein n=1 Tax=Pleurodeles waltl TaxID=8319 RepID=A0AAV7SAW4_PLEWA|nr:hypothetical protein NDU88_002421 [Pleurodeles waltl]
MLPTVGAGVCPGDASMATGYPETQTGACRLQSPLLLCPGGTRESTTNMRAQDQHPGCGNKLRAPMSDSQCGAVNWSPGWCGEISGVSNALFPVRRTL